MKRIVRFSPSLVLLLVLLHVAGWNPCCLVCTCAVAGCAEADCADADDGALASSRDAGHHARHEEAPADEGRCGCICQPPALPPLAAIAIPARTPAAFVVAAVTLPPLASLPPPDHVPLHPVPSTSPRG